MRTRNWSSAAGAVLSLILGAGLIIGMAPGEAKKAGEKKSSEKQKSKKGDGDTKIQTYDLDTLGTLGGPAKGSVEFYELTYQGKDAKKKNVKKVVWLKIDSGTKLLVDRMVGCESFKENDELKVFAKPRESQAGGKAGLDEVDRRLQAARVVLGGKERTVNESFSDAKDKDFAWCDVSIEKPGGSPTVRYESASYKMTLDKGAAVLRRDDADMKKDIRKGARILVQGTEVAEKPTGEKEDRTAFQAVRIIVLDPRSSGWWAALMP
jgi:hypothetical protein